MRASRLPLLLLLLAACAAPPPEPSEPPQADHGAQARPLAVPAVPGNGAWVLSARTQSLCASTGTGPYCVNTVAAAGGVLDSVAQGLVPDVRRAFALPRAVNLSDGASPNKPGAFSLADVAGATDADDVSLSLSGWLKIPPAATPAAAKYSFVVGSDEGYRLRIFDGSTERVDAVPGMRAFAYGNSAGESLQVTFPQEGGLFPFELVWFDRIGVAGLQWLWVNAVRPVYPGAGGWTAVPRESLYSADLRAGLVAEKPGGGVVSVGDSVRWTLVLRNAGPVPLHPAPDPGWSEHSRAGILFSTCLPVGLELAGWQLLPPGVFAETLPGAVACGGALRLVAYVERALAPGEALPISWQTFVRSGSQICVSGTVVAAATDRSGLAATRVVRVTDNPSIAEETDAANGPASLAAGGAGDDDETCFMGGNALPEMGIDQPAPGSLAGDARPPAAGSAPRGAPVRVRFSCGAIAGECTTAAGSTGIWSCAPDVDLPDGPCRVEARIEDEAGTAGPRAAVDFVVNTHPPAQPALAAVPTPSNERRPLLRGQSDAGTTVFVTTAAGELCRATADAARAFECRPDTGLADGTYTARARALDPLARWSTDSPPVVFVVDTVPPAAPELSGPPPITGEATPLVEGQAESGSTVRVQEGAALLCSATAAANGRFSCRPSARLADGPHTVQVRAVDRAGNTGAAAERDFTVDTVAPARPPVDPLPASTREATPALGGACEAGSTVRVRSVSAGGALSSPLCTAACPAGVWSCRPGAPLADGAWTLEADATDAAGNRSAPCSAGPACPNRVSFQVDTARPPPPTFDPLPAVVAAPPVVRGACEAGARVLVRLDDAPDAWCEVESAGGRFECPAPTLADGLHVLHAVALDAAGNSSDEARLSVTLDRVPPEPPLLDALAPVLRAPPEVTGAAEAGARVRLWLDDQAPWCDTTASAGRFTCPPPAAADGAHVVHATAADAAGNVSAAATAAFLLDRVAPAPPVLDAVPALINRAPVLAGAAEPGARVRVREGAQAPFCDVPVQEGRFRCPDHAFGEGPHALTADAVDVAGNASRGVPATFVIDTVAPARPVLDALPPQTREGSPAIAGAAEPRALVRATADGAPVCQATAGADGRFLCRPAEPLADGPHRLAALAVDPAGNEGPPSEPVDLVVDTRPPAPPTLSVPGPARDKRPVLSGTTEPGASVEVAEGSEQLCRAVADAAGVFSCRAERDLAERTHDVSARATDLAGNAGPWSEPTPLVVDLTPPPPPALDRPGADAEFERELRAGGRAWDAAQVVVLVREAREGAAAQQAGPAVAVLDGLWEFAGVPPRAEAGPYELVAVAIDAAGNESAPSAPVQVHLVGGLRLAGGCGCDGAGAGALALAGLGLARRRRRRR